MDANQVKQALTNNDLLNLLIDLGGDPQQKGSDIYCRTICHNPAHEGKHKLVYYEDSKIFHCYSGDCGNVDIYGLIGKIMDLDFFNAFKYICLKFGYSYNGTFNETNAIESSFFSKFKNILSKTELNELNQQILNSYETLFHESWIDDGITKESMLKYNIRFSILNNQIIIPHYNVKDDLIGVRARNLNKEFIDRGMKYLPVFWKGKILKHPLGASLYGININKKQIQNHKKAVIFESEKGVLQLDSIMPDFSVGVSICGSSFSYEQLDILKDLGVEEVIIALDKEYTEIGTQEEKFYAQKIQNTFVDKLLPYFRVSIIWDQSNLLGEKQSPTDRGPKVFQQLMNNRIYM